MTGSIGPYIRLHGKRLYGLCRTLCLSVHDADDLYQETWLRALRGFSGYDPARAFEPWIARICVNAYRSSLRRRKRSPIFDAFPSAQAKDALLEKAEAPPQDERRELHEAVDELPEKLRLAVILYYFRDMDIRETARALGIPAGTVKSRLNEARKRLKEALHDASDL